MALPLWLVALAVCPKRSCFRDSAVEEQAKTKTMQKPQLALVGPATVNGTVDKRARPPKRRTNAETRAREYLTGYLQQRPLCVALMSLRRAHRQISTGVEISTANSPKAANEPQNITGFRRPARKSAPSKRDWPSHHLVASTVPCSMAANLLWKLYRTNALLTELVALSDEKGAAFWKGAGRALRGWFDPRRDGNESLQKCRGRQLRRPLIFSAGSIRVR
jgi:hypothetical protein